MEIIIIDKNIYSLKAIFSAAYIFLEDFYIFLEEDEKGKILVQIKGKDEGQDLKKVVDEFKNELINAGLRLKVSEDNKKIREMIVSTALYGRIRNSDEGYKIINDPAGIGKTWEEEYKDKNISICENRENFTHQAIDKNLPNSDNPECLK